MKLHIRFLVTWIIVFSLSIPLYAISGGHYQNPQDLTLKIRDPFAQENTDLMQPVVGDYTIKVLPGHIPEEESSDRFLCEGLYYKQVGDLIYIDIRQPPIQQKPGYFDLFVSLSVPGEDEASNRQERKIVYVDSATDVLMIIDNSGSMKKNDPKGLRFRACDNFVRLAALSEQISKVGIIKFSGSAKTILPLMSPRRAKEMNIDRLLSRSRSGNFTNINEALDLAADIFEDSHANEKVAILLTDGQNEPDRYRDSHKLLEERGVKVYTVGLSKSADKALLKQVAFDTGGEFFEAVNDEKLVRIYNQIALEISDFRQVMDGVSAKGIVKIPVTEYDDFIDLNLFSYA
ncbi:MAG: VWA domain-containing protein, partial [Planctomycetes bacterium]|nr:VWA domain-containing protein [Planctomycetota bacterium]